MNAEPKPTDTRSRGRSTWRWIVAGIVVAGLLGLPFFWPAPDVFEIKGVPFRTWVAQNPDFQIQDLLAEVGTNAIPHLVRILREPQESPRVFQVKAWIWQRLPRYFQLRLYRWYPVPRWQIKRTALFGLRFLGHEARVALPDVLRVGHAETNRMVRSGALVAALQIAPESPETFSFWREQWEGTNYSRHDLAIYLRSARCPIPAAVPLLLKELEQNPNSITVLEAFEFFGEAAKPMVPYVIRAVQDGTYRGNLLQLCKRLGPLPSEAAPVAAASLGDDNPDIVAGALQVLKGMGPPAHSVLPAILPLLTNKDPMIQMLAATAAARIRDDARIALPVLLDGLEDRLPGNAKAHMRIEFRQEGFNLATHRTSEVAAILLGDLGPAAQPALPALEQHLGHSNVWVRLAAAQAVWRISGDSKQVVPVLVAVLDSQAAQAPRQSPPDYELVRSIEVIEEIGPAAKDAIPALERIPINSMRARNAVNAALAKIRLQAP